jgi:hypothetical protein
MPLGFGDMRVQENKKRNGDTMYIILLSFVLVLGFYYKKKVRNKTVTTGKRRPTDGIF